jgi:hypothetical protein
VDLSGPSDSDALSLQLRLFESRRVYLSASSLSLRGPPHARYVLIVAVSPQQCLLQLKMNRNSQPELLDLAVVLDSTLRVSLRGFALSPD